MSLGFCAPHDIAMLEPFAATLASEGFTWMQIAAPSEIDRAAVAVVRRVAERHGLILAVHSRFLSINLAAPDECVRTAAVAVGARDIDFAWQIGARLIVFHPGDANWYDFPPAGHPSYSEINAAWLVIRERHIAAARESLAILKAYASLRNVRISVENLYRPWELLRTPTEVKDFLLPQLDGIGFTLDVGHANVAGCDPVDFINALEKRIDYSHWHWNDGAYDLHASLIDDSYTRRLVDVWSLRLPEVPVVLELFPRAPQDVLSAATALEALGLRRH